MPGPAWMYSDEAEYGRGNLFVRQLFLTALSSAWQAAIAAQGLKPFIQLLQGAG